MWQRWNSTTKIFEKSSDNGGSWAALGLDAAIITQGTVAPARLGSGSSITTKFLRGDSSWQTIDLSAVWPIGSVFMSVVSTNPNTLLGFGTWVAFGTGRAPVGIDTGQTEFDTVEKTGGAKTVTLSSAEMPSHTHTQNSHNHTVTDPGHRHILNGFADTAGGVAGGASLANPGSGTQDPAIMNTNTTGITLSATTPTNNNTGGGGAHNNLQPYIVVYMWKRTA